MVSTVDTAVSMMGRKRELLASIAAPQTRSPFAHSGSIRPIRITAFLVIMPSSARIPRIANDAKSLHACQFAAIILNKPRMNDCKSFESWRRPRIYRGYRSRHGRRASPGMPTHHILTDKLAEFGASSKLNAELPFLSCSRPRAGLRRSTSHFLKSHGADLGKRSTEDLDVLLAEC